MTGGERPLLSRSASPALRLTDVTSFWVKFPRLDAGMFVNMPRFWQYYFPRFTQITSILDNTVLSQSSGGFPLRRVGRIGLGILRRGWLKTLGNPAR
jgi:hypothetical protein